ncbi:GDP-mannose 4,6-dehydratase [Crassaminicella thermophila]|nr:GDP-mannose 4,6-dehydratase [Crassaminicella thermophila]
MNTILVTGGAGFIGSHLIEKLLYCGKNIIAIDNFNDYYDPKAKEKNLMEIKSNMKRLGIDKGRFKLYRQDIRNKTEINRIFKEHKIDIIIHLAAMAGVRYSILAPDLYYDVNVNGTLNLLEAAKENKIDKFIFASSSSVYGNNKKIPFNENDSVDCPISPYAASKKAGELLCYTYYHLHKISIACLRFFTVYGPRQRPDLAIHKFAKCIMEGKKIPFFGDGDTQRDYTYIDDIIDGIIKTMVWMKKNKRQYEIFNLGNSRTIFLNQMVKTLEEVLNKKALLEKLPSQPGDMGKTYADIIKAKTILGYAPKKDFKEGVEDFVKWMKK